MHFSFFLITFKNIFSISPKSSDKVRTFGKKIFQQWASTFFLTFFENELFALIFIFLNVEKHGRKFIKRFRNVRSVQCRNQVETKEPGVKAAYAP